MCVVFINNDRYIISGRKNNAIQIWEREIGNKVQNLTRQRDSVKCVAFSNDYRYNLR